MQQKMIVTERSDIECNVEDIVSNPAEEKVYLKRLSLYLSEKRSNFTDFLAKGLNNCKGTSNKLVKNEEHIVQLMSQIKTLEATLDENLLSQKVLQKQINTVQSMEENLNEEIEKEKELRDALTLELVDLQDEIEKVKDTKRREWNAIKLANGAYRENLNLHLTVKSDEDLDIVTLTFFYHENPNRDTYYVVLEHSSNSWRVSNIQPPLKDKYLTEMNLDFSRDYETSDITRFLCQIRTTFLKHYSGYK